MSEAAKTAALAIVSSETDWRPKATHANAKNTVRECYAHEHPEAIVLPGYVGLPDRHYLDWCEAKAVKWIALADSFGYTGWTSEIRTLTGSITYHEWLKREVGL